MTYAEAVKEFRNIYADLYEKGVDYWSAQFVWSNYTDTLCKDGRITQRQYDNWKTPFAYGKHLKTERRFSR